MSSAFSGDASEAKNSTKNDQTVFWNTHYQETVSKIKGKHIPLEVCLVKLGGTQHLTTQIGNTLPLFVVKKIHPFCQNPSLSLKA